MQYTITKEGIFLRRPNRFVAYVLIDGVEEKVHVKNTGRCKELLIPGTKVILEKGSNPKRKTRYSLIAVWKGERLINMDSQAPNKVVEEALRQGKIHELGEISYLKPETNYGSSRLDFYFEAESRKGFIEVKGVTLEEDGLVKFPDAPTARGARHLQELEKAVAEGFEAYLFFLIQMKGVRSFLPNAATDPFFTQTLKNATQNGVSLILYDCFVTPNSLRLGEPVLCSKF